MSNFIFLEDIEKDSILTHVKETLDVMPYPTPLTFSSITRLVIVGFLRGRGVVDDSRIRSDAIEVFRQLSEYATKNPQYGWFDDWTWKIIKKSKERKIKAN